AERFGVFGPAARRGFRATKSAADVSKSSRIVTLGAAFGRIARPDLVGCRCQCHGYLGSRTRDEPAKLDVKRGRKWQALPCAAGGADSTVPGSLEKCGPYTRTASVGEPLDRRFGEPARPLLFRRGIGTDGYGWFYREE